jgi:methylated-DNA-[protein]-cysteine S-methyltransferase
MSTTAYALFDTAIGACAVAWGDAGITGVFLPLSSAERLRGKLVQRYGDTAREAAPTPAVAAAVAAMTRLLAGEAVDLTGFDLDLSATPEFNRKVYDIARAIPPGQTMTYGDIARRLGDVALSRDVGRALGENRHPIIVPCHRVVAASGKTGGFSAPGGVQTKMRMLSIERAGADGGLFGDLPLAAKPGR